MKCNFEKNKSLGIMYTNEMDFDEKENIAKNEAKEIYGDTIFDDIYLPSNFNLHSIDAQDIAKKYIVQECRMPFSDETINNMITMPKKAINEVFSFNHNGKSIHGTLLLGEKDGKHVLFLLKIESNCQHKDFSNFSIQLHACVQGQAWVNLLRLDSSGHPHPNYLYNGHVAKKESEVTYARTPHLHKIDYITQVVTDSLSYSLAEELPFFNYDLENVTDKFMFKKMVNYFLNLCNAKVDINEQVQDDYLYSMSQPLFSCDIPDIRRPGDLDNSWDGGKQ